VSHLRKYIPNPSHVLELDDMQVREDLFFEARPVRIKYHQIKQLRDKTINIVKVLWYAKSEIQYGSWKKP